jgi:hypothetical protein
LADQLIISARDKNISVNKSDWDNFDLLLNDLKKYNVKESAY